jgi:hypothetical protein
VPDLKRTLAYAANERLGIIVRKTGGKGAPWKRRLP